jgi:hypothetical protein
MAADPQHEAQENALGLMAVGSSDSWEVAVDESLDKDRQWEAEIEGPKFYITFSLRNLRILHDALAYLQSRILNEGVVTPNSTKDHGLTLGEFGKSNVTLIWDNEGFDRCFFIIQSSGNSAIRLTLLGEDSDS